MENREKRKAGENGKEGKRMGKKYLFAHFTGDSGDGEQVYFAVSGDGLHWHDLNGGEPVLRSGIGEKGVRDPFILRSRLDGSFYILATDLRIAAGKGWDVAQHAGSRNMVIWESKDLVHWSAPWFYRVPLADAGCVWAPEAIFDPKRGIYLVFWASCVKREGDPEAKQRIYSSCTADFRYFTEPRLYIERGNHVIDTTIVEENGVFYRFSKDETVKNIRLDRGTDLLGDFTDVPSDSLNGIPGVEGPAAFALPDGQGWCLLLDRFAERLGYLPLICRDLEGGVFSVPEDYDMGHGTKRHGSVLELTEAEYGRLLAAWGGEAR